MKATLATLLAIVAFAGFAAPARAAGNAVVTFMPVNSSVQTGDVISVDVTVANVDADPGLAQYDLTIHVDPALVRIENLTDSGFITTGQTIVVCVPGTIDNAAGTAVSTCTPVPLFGLPGVSTAPAVVLLHASLTALAAGTSQLTLSGTLAGPAGTTIPATFERGSINVSAPAPATSPTATASPTPAPSPTVIAATPTSVSTPRSQPTAAANTPAPASQTAAAPLKVPPTGSGGSGVGYSWTALVVAILALGGLGACSYAFWRHRRLRD